MLVLILFLLSVITLLNYRTCPDVRYPPFLVCVSWLLAIVLYSLAPIQIHTISLVTALIFVVTVISFSVGGLLAFHNRKGSNDPFRGTERWDWRPAHPLLRAFFLMATVAMLPILFSHASELAEQSGLEDIFMGLRTELSSNDSTGYGVLLTNAGLLSFFTTFLCAVELGRSFSSRAQYYLSLSVSLIYAVLSTGRMPMLLILTVLMGVALMRRRLTLTKMIAGSFIFLFFFASFAVLLHKGGDPDASWSENSASVRDTFFIYAVGALPAFDRQVTQNIPLSFGARAFSGLFNIFYHLSGHKLISPIEEPVFVPFETNLYTGIQPVYGDFGILGVVPAFVLMGAATTCFYVKATRGDPLHTLYYALTLFPLVTMPIADQYFMALSLWVRLFLSGYLYFRASARFSLEFPAPTGIRHEVS